MIDRRHPRVPCCHDVILHCGERGIHYQTSSCDIGLGGLSVVGSNCMRPANVLDLSLKVQDRYLRIPSYIAWANDGQAGIAFAGLSELHLAALTMLISPCWDGKDIFEGLMRLGQVVEMRSLRDCMATTTLLQTGLRKACRKRYV